MVPRRDAFTLLELCLALVIGLMIILLAVPSISGLLAQQRLDESYSRLSRLVSRARLQSIKDQRTCTLVWEKHAVRLISSAGASDTEPSTEDELVFKEDEGYSLSLPAALGKTASSVWTFWPSGACEPAEVAFVGNPGRWLARYDPLSGRGDLLSSEVR